MNDTTTTTTQPAANAWPRPTLTVLPPLKDLTLQSGVITGAGLQASGFTI